MVTLVSDMRDEIKSDLIITGSDFDTQIENKIRSALRQARGKRLWFLKVVDTITLSSASSSASLPTNFSAPGEFELSYSGQWLGDGRGFDFLDFDRLKQEYWRTNPLQSVVPSACAIVGSVLYASSTADTDYTIRITYYKQDVTLPTAAQTSVWFEEGYDAIRALAQFLFKRDANAYLATEEDGSLATYHMEQLFDTHNARTAGR